MSDSASSGPLFEDGKAEGAMRTIGEVSAAFGIKPHVLRYWEQQFPSLNPLKRSGGRRLYRAEDVAMVETINRLVNEEGYTLKGAKKAISAAKAGATGAILETSSALATPPKDHAVSDLEKAQDQQLDVKQQLRQIRDRLAAALD
ncbi:MerR family transcriptional regulator [Aurantiacibacter sediminis]|uniref:MerR family transcriptional regulator n=1 Tax=Aurantiacibacter sediminis TaxID=2793064 RepID=A0ABS0N5B4_9SPHN|nr:MerR family transcriptional regulator [Aurantiacibacter sediminis]MBH5322979.1 MerR family transcriptional regulator [Aurantiacibacter sediminis]